MPRRKLSDLRVVQVPRAEEVINNEDLSDVGSSQVPKTVENVEIEAGNGRRRKSRGRTTLNELYNRPAGDRAKVSRKVTSRQQQKFTHTAGSKSFARITNDEQLATGTSVGRIKLFDITHTKKDDSPMTSEAAEIMTKLREKRTEYETTASTNGSVNMDEIENQVIADVLGPERYGRVRCQESFVTPTKYFGLNSFQYMPSQSQSSQEEIDRLKQQLTQFQAEVEAREAERERREAAREAEIAAREVERERREAAREAEIAAREAEREAAYQNLQREFQEMITMLKRNQPKNLPS